MKPVMFYNVLLNERELVAVIGKLDYYLIPVKKFESIFMRPRVSSKVLEQYKISSQLFDILCLT